MPTMMPAAYALAISLPKDASEQQWVALAVGVLATCYLVMRGRAKAKRQKDPFERPHAFGVSQQRQIERDISNLMVEMLETARQMTAQLDTRATRLELLINEADAKLAALKTATAATPVWPPAVEVAASNLPVSDAPAPAVDAVAPMTKPETPPDPRHGEIYSLADQGRSTHEIARQLDRPNGEVELILALRSH
jgi:hypothetical protein